jgi:hypothetical protein
MVTMNAETSAKAFPNAPTSPPSPEAEPLANPALQVLIDKGDALKNFGQCIIFMLNRERTCFWCFPLIPGEMSLQLLILKLLYLIFTTPETYEYFYNNDLRVLVDVFIRELHDLPDDAESVKALSPNSNYSYDTHTSAFCTLYYLTRNSVILHTTNVTN